MEFNCKSCGVKNDMENRAELTHSNMKLSICIDFSKETIKYLFTCPEKRMRRKNLMHSRTNKMQKEAFVRFINSINFQEINQETIQEELDASLQFSEIFAPKKMLPVGE